MKQIIIFISALLLSLTSFGQSVASYEAKQIKAIDSLRLAGNWVKGVTNDTALSSVSPFSKELPSSYAVKNFLLNRLPSLTPYLKYADTATMFSGYLRKGHGMRYIDTASMLSGYVRTGNVPATGVQYSDTSSMLSGYQRSGNPAANSLLWKGHDVDWDNFWQIPTQPGGGLMQGMVVYGANNKLILTSVNYVRSVLNLGTAAYTASSDYVLATSGVKYSDTAAMHTNLLRKSDTAQMMSGYARTGVPVTTASQPNITSVGTLIGLTVTAPIGGTSTGNYYRVGVLSDSTGITLIRPDGTRDTVLFASSGGSGGSPIDTAAMLSNYQRKTSPLTLAAQPNITSIGALSALSIAGSATVLGTSAINGAVFSVTQYTSSFGGNAIMGITNGNASNSSGVYGKSLNFTYGNGLKGESNATNPLCAGVVGINNNGGIYLAAAFGSSSAINTTIAANGNISTNGDLQVTGRVLSRCISTSATSLDMQTAGNRADVYIYTGDVDATWNLPRVEQNAGRRIVVHMPYLNGSGNFTLTTQTSGASGEIIKSTGTTGALARSTNGARWELECDGTNWFFSMATTDDGAF